MDSFGGQKLYLYQAKTVIIDTIGSWDRPSNIAEIFTLGTMLHDMMIAKAGFPDQSGTKPNLVAKNGYQIW